MGEHKMKITKTKLKEIIREELLKEAHPHNDKEFMVIMKKAEQFGKDLYKYAHKSSRSYTKDANRIVGKTVKQYDKTFNLFKDLYHELLKG